MTSDSLAQQYKDKYGDTLPLNSRVKELQPSLIDANDAVNNIFNTLTMAEEELEEWWIGLFLENEQNLNYYFALNLLNFIRSQEKIFEPIYEMFKKEGAVSPVKGSWILDHKFANFSKYFKLLEQRAKLLQNISRNIILMLNMFLVDMQPLLNNTTNPFKGAAIKRDNLINLSTRLQQIMKGFEVIIKIMTGFYPEKNNPLMDFLNYREKNKKQNMSEAWPVFYQQLTHIRDFLYKFVEDFDREHVETLAFLFEEVDFYQENVSQYLSEISQSDHSLTGKSKKHSVKQRFSFGSGIVIVNDEKTEETEEKNEFFEAQETISNAFESLNLIIDTSLEPIANRITIFKDQFNDFFQGKPVSADSLTESLQSLDEEISEKMNELDLPLSEEYFSEFYSVIDTYIDAIKPVYSFCSGQARPTSPEKKCSLTYK